MRDNYGYIKKNKKVKGIVVTAFACLICMSAITFGVVSLNKRDSKNEKETQDVVDLNNVKKNNTSDTKSEETKEKEATEEKSTKENSETTKADENSINHSDNRNNTDTENEVLQNDITTEQMSNVEASNLPSEESTTANAVEGSVDTQQDYAAEVAGMISQYSFNESDVIEWPVNGNVVLDYSMDSTIYFPTLDSYRCNPAIVIQSENGTSVYAGVNGVVKEVAANEEIGNYVVVGAGSGYELTYGQLDDVAVSVGATVEPGTAIGVVGEVTRYYKNEGPNLYLEVTKDGTPCDPLDYLR